MSEEQKQDVFDKDVTVQWKDRKHWMWFPFSFTKYALKNDRLYTDTGFFNTHYDELLLYRVTDICLNRTLWQKLFGTGTITLSTRIDTNKEILLVNIKNPLQVKEILSDAIEKARDSRDLVRKDFFGAGGLDEDDEEFHDMM